MCMEGFTLLNWGQVAAAHKRRHNGAQPWLQTILKQLKEWHVIVFCDQSGETLQAKLLLHSFSLHNLILSHRRIYTSQSNICVSKISFISFYKYYLLHTYWKVNLFILSSQLDTECLGDFKGSIYSYIFTTLSQHYNQTNMKDIDYDNQTKW